MGIDDVAALAARAAPMPPVAAMTATLRRTRSAARAGRRTAPRPSGIRLSHSAPRHNPLRVSLAGTRQPYAQKVRARRCEETRPPAPPAAAPAPPLATRLRSQAPQ